MRVVERLQKNGFEAFIVGGAVRDILLDFRPKDFDVATSARPEEVRQVFLRRSRIIGRRFRIVHVYVDRRRGFREFLEVSTFRADGGRLGKDEYGTAREDAQRRDFTVNAFLYDPVRDCLYDYADGLADMRARRLRVIGNPKKRLVEDPVRILRAIRLSAKLGLELDGGLRKPLAACAPLLADIPEARLFDELVKVIKSGAGARILSTWHEFGISRHILPILGKDAFFFSVMAENDRRCVEGRAASLSFVTAALFWPTVARYWRAALKRGGSSVQAMEEAVARVDFGENAILPQRLLRYVKELFFMQAAMEGPVNRRRASYLVQRNYFDRAVAFAACRQDGGAAQTASWWVQYVNGNRQERERMIAVLPKNKRGKKGGG